MFYIPDSKRLMKFTILSKTLSILAAVVLLTAGVLVMADYANAQVVNPYPSLYMPTTTQFSMPYMSTFGNGNDMFQQQIIQFLSFLNNGQNMYMPGFTYTSNFGSSYGFSSSTHTFEEPDVETDNARNIDRYEAELRGEVDMNDAIDGTVFFVYGEDEDQIEDVERDYDSYSDVDEDGDDLQKIRVERRFNGDDTFSEDVEDLNRNTRYYFVLCVEYEDEDEDDTLECGRVEEFRTDD